MKFLFLVALFATFLSPLDRYFFKNNASFSIRYIYSAQPSSVKWTLPALTSAETMQIDPILDQPFTYFAKGTHCYAFLSEDGNYVLKFHRYPSHMRPLSWVTHPLSYHFHAKRKAIKQHNVKRHDYFMSNYKISYTALKKETGMLLLHIQGHSRIKKTVTLIDKTQNRYRVKLDDVTCILQYKAERIFPMLEHYLTQGEKQKARQAISSILDLIVHTCKKGFINADPVLKRNYGLIPPHALFIDIGDLVVKEGIQKPENYLPHLREVTKPLQKWLEERDAELLAHYEQQMLSHFCDYTKYQK